MGRHTQVMKIAAQIVVLVIAVVALYALPAPSPDECPEGEVWSCVGHFADLSFEEGVLDDDASLRALVAANTEGESDDSDADADQDAEDAEDDNGLTDGVELTSDGVLLIDTDSAEFEYELLTGTKWSHELFATAEDGRVLAVTYESDEVSAAAPRIMQAPPTRLQIIDFSDEDSVFDEELPEEVVWMDWLDDDRLVLGGRDGSVTVFALS